MTAYPFPVRSLKYLVPVDRIECDRIGARSIERPDVAIRLTRLDSGTYGRSDQHPQVRTPAFLHRKVSRRQGNRCWSCARFSFELDVELTVCLAIAPAQRSSGGMLTQGEDQVGFQGLGHRAGSRRRIGPESNTYDNETRNRSKPWTKRLCNLFSARSGFEVDK